MAARIRAHDWAASPLDPPERWPQSLQTATDLMLAWPGPASVLWGSERLQLYNDAYIAIAAARHPHLLGRPAGENWSEAYADFLGPLLERTQQGHTTVVEDQAVALRASGGDGLEERVFTAAFLPIRDEAGAVGGIFHPLTETTEKVRAEAAQRASQARQAFLLRLADALRPLADAVQMQREACRLLGEHLQVAQVGFGEIDARQAHVTVQRDWNDGRVPSGVGTWRMDDFGAAFIADMKRGQTIVIADVLADPRTSAAEAAAAFAAIRTRAILNVPLVKRGCLVAMLFVNHCEPRDWLETEVRLVEETGERLWAAVERASAESALRDSEARFRALAQASSDGFYFMSPDWSQMRELTSTGFLANTSAPNPDWLAQYIHPDDQPRCLAAIRQAVRTRSVFDLEHRVRRADGSLGWVHSRAAPILDASGAIVEWFGSVGDVTARHAAEDALRQADRAKDEFLAMLAHELRNPLAPLVNAHRLIERTEPISDAGRAALAMAQRQTRQLHRLVDDLLEVSRISRGKIELKLEPIMVATAVHQAAESVAAAIAARGQTLGVAVPEEPARIVADPARIAQVLENLLTNASKYTPEGGAIRVELDARPQDVEIRVVDNGIGIEPARIAELFELFSQIDATLERSQGGLGIGLALVKRLVELHGGSVAAASPGKGQGATFTVRLPRPQPPH